MIDTPELLAAFVKDLEKADWIALDTEADSLHAYPEKICLLQLTIPQGDFILDPLAGLNLESLWSCLKGRELIMHGADYDLRLLSRLFQFVPSSIFETMLASRLIGLTEFSLTNLVEKYFQVTLEKGPQTANWARRPLTEKMEIYARNDTHYLKPLADILRGGLEKVGRLEWHREWCARLIEECSRPAGSRSEAWRIKGSSQLSPRALAVLREIWLWREETALSEGRPPYFILSHEVAVDMAIAGAGDRDVEPMIPRHLRGSRRDALKAAIQLAVHLPPQELPAVLTPSTRRQSASEKGRFDELRRRRDAQALKLEIDPTIIGGKSLLSALAEDWETGEKQLLSWQKRLLEAPLPG